MDYCWSKEDDLYSMELMLGCVGVDSVQYIVVTDGALPDDRSQALLLAELDVSGASNRALFFALPVESGGGRKSLVEWSLDHREKGQLIGLRSAQDRRNVDLAPLVRTVRRRRRPLRF